ncbi:MAG: DNA mismatch repair endonuclease MutL [Verrucomicrobiota bacterium]
MTSSKIQKLDTTVANRIAAGEVVERPASVVKELVENALDAGSRKISIDIEKGGKRLIRVTDDGSGMNRDDAMMSLERHATSKLKQAEDLEKLATLGFRGEALPSIASVSLFRMQTREHKANEGTQISIEGGEVKEVRAAGGPAGTEIEIRTLFSHVPARRKFLKADGTEWGHIESYLIRAALCHPSVQWQWRHNGGRWQRYPVVETLDERIRQILGKPWVEDTLAVNPVDSSEVWNLRGRVSKPGRFRNNRQEQFWFINGRPVVHSGLQYALQEGYGQYLPKGSYPIAVLFIELPPEGVDINVHPAKREVRLRNETAVRRFVSESIDETLRQRSAPLVDSKSIVSDSIRTIANPPEPRVSASASLRISLEPEQKEWGHDLGLSPTEEPGIQPVSEQERERIEQIPLTMLGALHRDVLLAENEEGLVAILIQAAYERIYYEEILARFEKESGESQRLLVPITLEFSAEIRAFVEQAESYFVQAGISISSLGGGAFMVDALPPAAAAQDPERFVREVVDHLMNASNKGSTARRLQNEPIAEAIARQMSRGKYAESEAEVHWLIRRLHACDLPYTRPDGRPSMILLSRNELNRRFQID